MNTLPNGQKPPGAPPWWPFGTVAKPPTTRAIRRRIKREIVNEAPEALL